MISDVTSRKLKAMSLLASFAVVAMHCGKPSETGTCFWYCYQALTQGVFRAAVPFFFLLSGFFLCRHVDEQGWWKREVFKRIGSIAIPYFCWNIFLGGISAMIVLLANLAARRSVFANLSNIDLTAVFGINLGFPCDGALWYLRMLFVLVLISPLLFRLSKSFFAMAILLACYAVFDWADCGRGNPQFLPGFFSVEGLFYFCVGLRFGLGVPRLVLDERRRCLILCICVPVLLFLIISKICLLDTLYAVYIPVKIILVPVVMLLVWHLLFYCRGLLQSAWTGYSFRVYILHTCALPLFSLGIKHATMTSWLLGSILISLGSLCAAGLMEKRVPNASKLLFGGR